MKKLEIGIIGLGKFGLQLGLSLMENGHKVMGLDSDEAVVRSTQDILSCVYQGDATDKAVLDQLRVQDLDCVVVSVGSSMETSILTALNLHDLNVRRIIARANGPQHRTVLRRLGVHDVVQPELDVAKFTAMRLANPGMLDFIDVGGGILLQEAEVDELAGKTLMELNLTTTRQVMVVAIKKPAEKNYRFIPNPRVPLEKGDRLMLIGGQDDITSLKT